MEPRAAAEVIRRAMAADPKRPITVADASVTSGLALRDAEAGLSWLTSEYRGHLRVSEDGDLVHLFPYGFDKPWETKERLARIRDAILGAALAAGRFVVRAWLLVAMIGYALLFVALFVGLTFARGSGDRESPGLGLLAGLFRMIADALFWTFHPFSPIYVDRHDHHDRVAARDEEPKVPFYEKVNRFVFGPSVPRPDPHAARARLLAEIRAQRGRVTLADVMRVSGLPRDEADPLMARLMLDHDGTVEVSDGGGIVYRFEALRRTALEAPTERPPAAWERPPALPPLTGNEIGSDLLVAGLNGFNLLASAWVLQHGLTLANIALLFDRHRPRVLPDDGLPLALGLVPLLFSILIFALPLARTLRRRGEEKALLAEHARLAVLREVVTSAGDEEAVPDDRLRAAVRVATGTEPTSKEITAHVVELGGDVDVGPEGEVRYRFAGLEADAEAAEEERAAADDREARLGRIVYATDATDG
jgi:hypothetical protein